MEGLRFSLPRAIATTRRPALSAYWRARCPRPLIASTATRSPGRAPLLRSELKVVRPAHSSGAASAELELVGDGGERAGPGDGHLGVAALGERAGDRLVGAVHEVAVAAGVADPAVSAEPAHANPLAHFPAGDTVTEGVDPPHYLLPGYPGFRSGDGVDGAKSEWQMPQASTRIRTCPAGGSWTGSSASSNLPGATTLTA